MNRNKEKAIMEAILFSIGDAVDSAKLAEALECTAEEIKEIAKDLEKDYESEERGLKLVEIEGSYQLCTKGELYPYLIKIVKIPKDYKLTDVQLETLSIIAYKQPVTKIEIEKIRGVASDHAVNRLVDVGLVEEKGRLSTPGRPLVFGTTEEFLRRFGLKNKEDLPDINTDKVEEMRLEAEEEIGYIDEKKEEEAVLKPNEDE